MKHVFVDKNRLANILDYMSGDSWNGTHPRTVDIKLSNGGYVVQNSYNGHKLSEKFSQTELQTLLQDDVVKHTSHFTEFRSKANKLGLEI